MIGLVIVSHSRALAEALVGLVGQVSQQEVPIAIAAGVGPEREEFGTDAVEISEAIQSVDSPEGVLVLMDLGSAVMSAEMALELLPEETRSHVHFCAAPLIEGAIAAAVQAGLGSDLESACREAEEALLPKREHFGENSGSPAAPVQQGGPEMVPAGARSLTLELRNPHGLHARPAARFVQTAASFKAEVQVSNLSSGKGPVSARSLNSLATLGALHGHRIQVNASGPEAGQALQALQNLVESNFGEDEAEASRPAPTTPAPPASAAGGQQAVPISEGVALGPLFRYQPAAPTIPLAKTSDPAKEWERLQAALESTRRAIRARLGQMRLAVGEADAAIFEAHLLILEDPDLLEAVRGRIFTASENAAAAWNSSIQALAGQYQVLEDPYLQARAVDVLDVGRQVLFALAGNSLPASISLPGPVVLYAQDLTPTETTQLDLSQVLALALAAGGPTSHSAILARAMGIPAVSGVGPEFQRLPPGALVGVDGFSGRVWVEPEESVQAELNQRREAWLQEQQRLRKAGQAPAVTRDGLRVEIAANVGSLLDARLALENGAEAIGLLRTEFLYLTRSTPPSEAEQVESLRQIGEVMGDRPVIVRTLDVGGDKPLPYIQAPPEANPFLGVRALRLSLRNPELFLTQLRALLRAGEGLNFKVMFPMVANLDEVLQAKSRLEEAHRALEAEQIPHLWPIETGIMVEIPSAALLSESLAPHVDFFSIGTNDLTQYTLAAERGNPELAALQDAFHPAVLNLIAQVCEAAARHGKWVGICGELAGDPQAAPALVGLGVKELSMNPAGIPRVKEAIRALDAGEAGRLAREALQASSPAAAREIAARLQAG